MTINPNQLLTLRYKSDYLAFTKSLENVVEAAIPILVQYACTHEDRLVAQKASRTWEILCTQHIQYATLNIELLIAYCQQGKTAESIKRATLRILECIHIPQPLHESSIHLAYTNLEDSEAPVAIRCYAMGILCNLSALYPDIKNNLPELVLYILEHQQTTPAFSGKAKQVLKQLKKATLR